MAQIDHRFGYYIVAYLDILNQSKFLKSLDFFPENEEEIAKVMTLAKETFGAVTQLREIIGNCLQQYSVPKVDLSKFTEEQKSQFYELNRTEINYKGFSDCVAIYAPVSKGDQKSVNVMNVYAIMATCAILFLSFPATELCIRGGIDIGPGMIIFKDEFYGPALLRAYKLESEIAQYPRMAVGHGLINFLLSTIEKSKQDTIESQFSHNLAESCLTMISQDYDFWPILDYLGKGFSNLSNQSGRGSRKDLIKGAMKFIGREKQKCLDKMDQKLYQRYAILERYFVLSDDLASEKMENENAEKIGTVPILK